MYGKHSVPSMQPWGRISFYHHLCDYFLACLSKVTNLCSSVGNALACRAQCWGLIRGVLLASDKKGDWETRPLFRFAWFSDLANRTPETVRQTQPSSPGEITVMAALVKDDSSAGVANIAHTPRPMWGASNHGHHVPRHRHALQNPWVSKIISSSLHPLWYHS